MGGPREGQVTFSCLWPKTKIYRMNSKVQHGLWSNSANWTEFLSSRMSNISFFFKVMFLIVVLER